VTRPANMAMHPPGARVMAGVRLRKNPLDTTKSVRQSKKMCRWGGANQKRAVSDLPELNTAIHQSWLDIGGPML